MHIVKPWVGSVEYLNILKVKYKIKVFYGSNHNIGKMKDTNEGNFKDIFFYKDPPIQELYIFQKSATSLITS